MDDGFGSPELAFACLLHAVGGFLAALDAKPGADTPVRLSDGTQTLRLTMARCAAAYVAAEGLDEDAVVTALDALACAGSGGAAAGAAPRFLS